MQDLKLRVFWVFLCVWGSSPPPPQQNQNHAELLLSYPVRVLICVLQDFLPYIKTALGPLNTL